MNRVIPTFALLIAAPIAYVSLSLWLGMTGWQVLFAFLISTTLTFVGLGVAHVVGKTQFYLDYMVVVHLVTIAAGTSVFIDPMLAIIPATVCQLLVGVASAWAKAILKQELGL